MSSCTTGATGCSIALAARPPTEYRIHLATSTDCTNWERVSADPLIVDGYEARQPMVVRIEDRWVLYYTATSTSEGGHFVVAAVESVSAAVERAADRVPRSDARDDGRSDQSPFVFPRGSSYYLSIGPDWAGLVSSKAETGRYDAAAYRRTRLLASRDPFRFDLDGQVATIDAHAAKYIVDEQGELMGEPRRMGSRRRVSRPALLERLTDTAPLTCGCSTGARWPAVGPRSSSPVPQTDPPRPHMVRASQSGDMPSPVVESGQSPKSPRRSRSRGRGSNDTVSPGRQRGCSTGWMPEVFARGRLLAQRPGQRTQGCVIPTGPDGRSARSSTCARIAGPSTGSACAHDRSDLEARQGNSRLVRDGAATMPAGDRTR